MENKKLKNGGLAYGKGGSVSCGCGGRVAAAGRCMKCGGKATHRTKMKKYGNGGVVGDQGRLAPEEQFMVKKDLAMLKKLAGNTELKLLKQ